jgi:excisionase family DNA binding protein
MNELLTPEQVADLLSCGRTYVYRLIREGQIESVKLGRLRRVPRESVDRFIERRLAQQSGDDAS